MEPEIDGTEAILAGCEALDGGGGAALVPRDVVEVVGPDAGRFLQGQLSQDVVGMAGRSAWSFLLAPTGRVDAWFCVHRVDPDRYLLEIDEGWGAVVTARLRRFLLRTDATIGEPMRWHSLRCRWGADVVRLGLLGDDDLASPAIAPRDTGVDLLVEPGGPTSLDGFVAVPPASIERHRIAHGVPRMGAELDDSTIPAEAGQWVIDASVSFTKGCYTGQELVARIDSRSGQVPRPVRLLRIDGAVDTVAVGDRVIAADDGAEQERGTLTSATARLHDDRPALALAPVARSVAVGDVVTVLTATGPVVATVVEPGSVG